MNDELRTDFTADERNTIIQSLRDEYGDREFSDELVLLECQDIWRKGCHNLEHCDDCRGCGNGYDVGFNCSMLDWEKSHPEYKDDELAKRLKELRDEVAGIQRNEIMEHLVKKGYVKVQMKRWNDDTLTKSQPLLYLPGEDKLKLAVVDAIANWKYMWGGRNIQIDTLDLNATSGIILKLVVHDGEEYEIWEII